MSDSKKLLLALPIGLALSAGYAALSFGLLSGRDPALNGQHAVVAERARDASGSVHSTLAATVVARGKQARYFVDNRGVAIRGTDPVAYFNQGGPVRGKSELAYRWNGATWHFSSAENRDLFAANPERYAPQYGGFCAWAVSQGYTAPIDPSAWKIVDGKLYLNFNQQIQRRWERDIPGNIGRANSNWPKLRVDA